MNLGEAIGVAIDTFETEHGRPPDVVKLSPACWDALKASVNKELSGDFEPTHLVYGIRMERDESIVGVVAEWRSH